MKSLKELVFKSRKRISLWRWYCYAPLFSYARHICLQKEVQKYSYCLWWIVVIFYFDVFTYFNNMWYLIFAARQSFVITAFKYNLLKIYNRYKSSSKYRSKISLCNALLTHSAHQPQRCCKYRTIIVEFKPWFFIVLVIRKRLKKT